MMIIEQTLISFKIRKNGTENKLSNLKNALTERFQLQVLMLHQSMSFSKALKIKRQIGKIYVSDSDQNIEATYMFKLKLTELNGFMNGFNESK